jgi:hypothetical protein
MATVIACMLAQIPLTIWWSRAIWLHADLIARLNPNLSIPNFIWAAFVLVGIPLCTVLGGLLGLARASRHAMDSSPSTIGEG